MIASDVDRLAARARTGERAAFVALVEHFQAPLLRFLSLRAASREDAEELTQETFLRAWKSLDRYDPRRPFAAWLYTLGSRLTISQLRRGRVATAECAVLEEAADAPQPVAILSAREEGENLWRVAREVLSPQGYTALWMRYAEDLGMRDIARALGKREPTVRVILYRARERLANHLEQDGAHSDTRPGPDASARQPYPGAVSLEPRPTT